MLQSVMSKTAVLGLWRCWVAVLWVAALVAGGLAAVPVLAQGGSGGGGPLVGLSLVDAADQVDVADQSVLAVLGDGVEVVLDRPDSGLFGVRAEVAGGASVGSVGFDLEGPKTVASTENWAPYSLYGDYRERVFDEGGLVLGSRVRLFGFSLPVGDYVLRASAFSLPGRGGVVLGSLKVSFRVVAADAAPERARPVPASGFDGCGVGPPPAALGVDGVFAKYCDAGGIRVVGSGGVPDVALQAVWGSVVNALAAAPAVHQRLADGGLGVVVLGLGDRVGDFPGYESGKGGARAVYLRGDGVVFVPEENVLCHAGDRFEGQDTVVRGVARAMFYELWDMDSGFGPRLGAAFAQARARGLWDGYYAGTGQGEYWAEGVRFFLHGAWGGEGEYAPVSRRELAERDPVLYSLVSEYVPAFGADEWQPFCVGRGPVVPVAPPAPRGLSAVAGGGESVVLEWDAVEADDEVTGYQIRRRIADAADSDAADSADAADSDADGGAEFEVVEWNTRSTETRYVDSTVVPGTGYSYTVAAGNAMGFGEASASVGVVTGDPPSRAVAPRGVSAVPADVSVSVSWVVPAQPVGVWQDEMFLERVVDGGDGDGEVVVWSVSVADEWDVREESSWSHTAGGLEAGTGYRFRVRLATMGHGDAFSEVVAVSTQSEAPAGPEGLSASVGGDGEVSLAWTVPAQPSWLGGVESMQVERSDTGVFLRMGGVDWARGTTAYGFVDGGPRRGLPYEYRVKMYAAGRWFYSDVAEVEVPARTEAGPGPLAGFSLVDASDQSLLGGLADGASVLLRGASDGDFSVRADIAGGAAVGSVRLELSGPASAARTESWAPYSLHGDQGHSRLRGGGPLPAGDYTLTATAYAMRYLRGDVLGTLEIDFKVVEDTRGQLAEAVLELTRATVRNNNNNSGAAGAARFGRGWAKQSPPPATASIVYLIDDSGSMDFGFPEVRTALEAVRDETMDNTKVALITFGTHAYTLFGLTDHSSAPWDDHIDDFRGRRGGTSYGDGFIQALNQLRSDTADVKKIIFLSDGQSGPGPAFYGRLTSSGVAVDTIAFGEESRFFSDLEDIATDTGGTYIGVKKPTSATRNDPEVEAESLSAILNATIAQNTATLFLVDASRSMSGPARDLDSKRDTLKRAMRAAANKARSTTGAQAGLAQFLGRHHTGYTRNADGSMKRAYTVFVEIGTITDLWGFNYWCCGSTDVDHALTQAYSTVSDATPANKRVVLITDGITGVDVSDTTLDKYKDDADATLVVVAWGDHADRMEMKSWADHAEGSFHVVE